MRTITANFRSMLSHPSVKWIVSFCLFCLAALGVAQAQTDNVYAVGQDAGCDPRMKVVFHQAGGTTTEIFVTAQDVSASDADFNQVLYNPGYGTLPSGVSFYGWTITESYTVADTANAMSIDDVRADVKNNFSAGGTRNYYAMLFKHYTVTYRDVDDAVLASDGVLYKIENEARPYRVNCPYIPHDGEHNFEGWRVDEGSENITGGQQNQIYQNSDDITISGDVTFSVYAPGGVWLVFDENGKGATYCAPQFVKSGENTSMPRPWEDMKRLGYTFQGWYLNPEGTGTQFNFGSTLTVRTTLYAKWTPRATAPYTIIIWKQNIAGGDKYDFVESKQFEGNVGELINDVSVRNATITTTYKYEYNNNIIPFSHYYEFKIK